ncbi:MAG: hypothetical protein HY900_16840 [Deltaproteobacteria bacterium]|nr:hypothetical protein [Deltaproteobacteria bacterium]
MEREEHPELEPKEAPAGPGGAASAAETPAEPAVVEGPSPAGEPVAPPLLDGPSPEGAAVEPEGEPSAPASEERPAQAAKRDSFLAERNWLPLAALAAFVLVLIIGAAALWQTRSELAATRSELAGLKASARRTELLLARSGVVRARADLEGVRELLPADLSAEVERADGILAGVADRLKPSR